MIGLALVTTMAILGRSAGASVDAAIEENFSGDVVISNAVGTPFSPAVAQGLAEDPAVGVVSRVRFVPAQSDGRQRFVLGYDPATIGDVVRVEPLSGSLDDVAVDEVVISDDVAEDDGLAVGDEVTFTMPAGERTFTVAAIFERSAFLALPYAFAIEALVEAGYADEDNTVYLTAAEPGGQEALIEASRAATADIPLISVKDQQEYAEEQRAPIDQLLTLIYGLLGLALVIAILGIVNTLALSVIERTREVGLLRAVGLGRGQLRRMIGLESVVIAVLGTLLGLALGIVFGLALLTALADEGLEAIVVPWGQLGGFVVAAVVVGVLAAFLPARRAARLDVLRAIATE